MTGLVRQVSAAGDATGLRKICGGENVLRRFLFLYVILSVATHAPALRLRVDNHDPPLCATCRLWRVSHLHTRPVERVIARGVAGDHDKAHAEIGVVEV